MARFFSLRLPKYFDNGFSDFSRYYLLKLRMVPFLSWQDFFFLFFFVNHIEIHISGAEENGQNFTFLLSPHTLNSQMTQRYPKVLLIKFRVTLLSPYELKAQTTQRYQTSSDQSWHCLQPIEVKWQRFAFKTLGDIHRKFWGYSFVKRRECCSNHFFPLTFPIF